ncbi:MAG: AraC family transcriptional regulator [Polyangiaceae bacterium]|nr:AraC family transcriptional regulator [Polyangiaceae bacterium]
MYVSSVVIRALSAELSRLGIDSETICDAVDLDSAALRDSTVRLSLTEEASFVAEAMRVSGRPDLGLMVGSMAPTHLLHVIGPLVLSVGTLREAAQLFFRYAPWLSEGSRYELIESGETARMRYSSPHVSGDQARFCAELNLAFIARTCERILGGGEVADRVTFAHPRPQYAEAYSELFRCPVEFGSEANEIHFESRLLDVERVPSDDSLRALLERRADQLLAMRDTTITLDDRLREVLRRERDLSRAAISQIPSRLGVGMKTLQRRLSEAGLSLTALVEGEQKRRAFETLVATSIPIKELAHSVGFSDATTFHRAFKRWTGMTPAEYRRRHGEGSGES